MNGIVSKEALLSFNSFINENTLIAHNLYFDWNILKSNYIKNGIGITANSFPKFDSIDITRRLFPKLNSYKLSDLIETLKFQGSNTHNALDDVKATANLIQFLIPVLENRISLQKKFYELNQSIIEKFQKYFSAIWKQCTEKFELETSYSKLIRYYVNYLKEIVNYKFENEDEYHLLKLLRHMEIKCGTKPLKLLLKKHIPEYKIYKEADLIIGDEELVISTIHKAKGLEFENVIVPECVNDVYPSWASKIEEEKNEDARILYVALSRAMKRLIITTHSISVNNYGQSFPRSRSYFIKCIENHFNRITS